MIKNDICENFGSKQICSARHLADLRTKFVLSASITAMILASNVQAQIPDDEVIVTATKREATIDEVPLAITALSGDFVKDVNLSDVKDLITYSPGVTGNSKDSFIDAVAIRGIRTQDFGVGGDPSVGFFKNGLYQGRNGAVVSSLFDMERAEILRGPQNFLFGRNAISGAISTHTKRPIFGNGTSGYADIEYGSRNRIGAEAAINFNLSDNVAARFAGYYSAEDGYVENAFTPNGDDLLEHDKWAVRGSIDYDDGGPLTVQVTAEYEDRDQSGSIYRATELGDNYQTLQDLFGPFSLPADERDINQDLGLGEYDRAEVFNVGVRIDYEMDIGTFTSQTGYKSHDYEYREDFDGTPLSINNFGLDQNGGYFEQEARLVSNEDGPLSWYVGASYYQEDLDALFTAQGDEETMCAYYYYAYYGTAVTDGTCLTDYYYYSPTPEGLLEKGFVNGKYSGYAAFADMTYQLSDKLDFSLGVRYSKDTKRFANNILPVTSELGPYFTYTVTTNGPLEDKKSWDAFTPRAIARYKANDDHMMFASVTRGFKSGGFGTFGFSPTASGPAIGFGDQLQPGDAVPDDFDPEKLWSYEVGHKGTFLDGALKTDINVFYYDYKDLQLLVFQDGGGLIFNLGNVTGKGVEGQVTAKFSDHFDGFISAGYVDTSISDAGPACSLASCDGNSLESPKFSGAAVLNAHTEMGGGEVFATAELFWESSKGGGIENSPISRVDSFMDLTLRAGYRGDDWSIIGYVENVTDELYWDQGNNNDGIIPAHFFGPSQPRTFGVRLSKSFGE